jgi:hypothetical protein
MALGWRIDPGALLVGTGGWHDLREKRMNLFPIFVLILLVLILHRLSYIAYAGSVSVSREAFLESLRRMDAPVVLVTERAYSWVLGVARHHYTCTYKNHRLHARSFSPLSLPSSADLIHVRKW